MWIWDALTYCGCYCGYGIYMYIFLPLPLLLFSRTQVTSPNPDLSAKMQQQERRYRPVFLKPSFLSRRTHSHPPDNLLSRFALLLHPFSCHMLQDDWSLIVALIGGIHIGSLISVVHTIFPHASLLTDASLPSCASPLFTSPHFRFYLSPLSLAPSFLPFPSIYFHPLTWPPSPFLFTDRT